MGHRLPGYRPVAARRRAHRMIGRLRDSIRQLLNWADVDRAVWYALLSRGWQFVSGPVTLVLVARHFTLETQGFFYTFASLIALQSFLELGFHIVIANFASHEWSRLELRPESSGGGSTGGPVSLQGDPAAAARLASFGRLVLAWYAILGALFVLLVAPAGWVFLGQKPSPVAWQVPWFVFVALSGGSLACMPFYALLEGCGQVARVNRFRVLQAVTGSLGVWLALVGGAGLWTAVAVAGIKLGWELYMVGGPFRPFLRHFLHFRGEHAVDWRYEVWPLQWRLAVQNLVGYFAYSLYTPVMWHYHGPAMAGRMGMTWSVLSALQLGALAWVQTRAPVFGGLAARREFHELDQLFTRLVARSLFFLFTGAVGFWLVVGGLNLAAPRWAERVLPLPALTVFLLGLLLHHIPNCQAIYIRAHKREWMLKPGVISSLLTGLLVWLWGWRAGPWGAGCAYVLVIGAFVFPYSTWLWRHCRRDR